MMTSILDLSSYKYDSLNWQIVVRCIRGVESALRVYSNEEKDKVATLHEDPNHDHC